MLKIAVPNKGALSDGAVNLLKSAGYKCKRSGRELSVIDEKNNVEFIYLRPRDIAVYVGNGTLDLGITGLDLAFDSKSDIAMLQPLNIGNSRFFYAVPKEHNWTVKDFAGKKIATSYPNIVLYDLEKNGVDASVVKLDGAVEISIQLGVADAIADVVESGKTLKEAGLKVIGEPIMTSEAAIFARSEDALENDDVKKLIERIRGVLVAREYVIVEYDIEKANLDAACKLTPGIESPTVSPLSDVNWCAVKSMIKSKDANIVMDELKAIGAKAIIITEIKSCRI
ncbi:ATP phosphoribosyltransferase [Lentisphaerota bacterium WC36G]|nr:ATP phosphoribosyltransferase [Lentisphaerae bacterium WC36]